MKSKGRPPWRATRWDHQTDDACGSVEATRTSLVGAFLAGPVAAWFGRVDERAEGGFADGVDDRGQVDREGRLADAALLVGDDVDVRRHGGTSCSVCFPQVGPPTGRYFGRRERSDGTWLGCGSGPSMSPIYRAKRRVGRPAGCWLGCSCGRPVHGAVRRRARRWARWSRSAAWALRCAAVGGRLWLSGARCAARSVVPAGLRCSRRGCRPPRVGVVRGGRARVGGGRRGRGVGRGLRGGRRRGGGRVGRGGGRWPRAARRGRRRRPTTVGAGPGCATAAPRDTPPRSRPSRSSRHRAAAVRSGAVSGTRYSGQSGSAGVVGSSRLPFKGLFSTLDAGRSPLSSTASVSCADSAGPGAGSGGWGVGEWGVGDEGVGGGAAVVGAEELGAGGVFDDDDESDVAGPGDDPGDGAGGAGAGVAEALRGERGDQAGVPVHGAHQLAQDRGPGGRACRCASPARR